MIINYSWVFETYFALFYFAGAALVWTIYFLKVVHYRSSVLYTVLLLSEFHRSAMQISLHLMRIWGIYTLARGCIGGAWSLHALVVLRICSIISCMLIENKGKIIILWNPMLISGDTLFCISQKDDFILHLAWHYRHVKPPKHVATKHRQCTPLANV